MESVRTSRPSSVSVIREEIELSSVDAHASPISRIDRALNAAANSIEEARAALDALCHELPQGSGDALRSVRVLLTVPQVCQLLGYHKTKVYGLMKRGLLPYVTDTKTGRRRVEYQAIQGLVKRLRGGHLERKVS